MYTSARALERATSADADAVLALYQSQIGHGTSDWDETYPTMAFIRDDLANGSLYVLRDTEGLLAAISLLADDDLNELPCWASARGLIPARLCVRTAMQGRGIAGFIMGETERIAREGGFPSIRLLCARTNPAARRVYEKTGYALRGETRLYDTDFLCFEKILTEV